MPINNSWGLGNRTVAFRVKNADPSRTYVENRMAGGSVNPYLLMVGTIIAGIDGIERKLELSNPIKGIATERKDLTRRCETFTQIISRIVRMFTLE